MTPKERREEKRLDKLVEQAYYRTCQGIAIPLLDIPKVFAEGRRALKEGRDLDAAVKDFVQTIRT